MSVTADIVQTYRAPRATVRRHLGRADEGRALGMLFGASFLIFIGEWPGLARAAELDPAVPFDARIGGALMATLFLLPLFAYALAFASHVALRLAGGTGTPYGARVALFWALLAVSPLMLLEGLVAGIVGPSPALTATGLVVLGAFLAIWGAGLAEAEFGRREPAA